MGRVYIESVMSGLGLGRVGEVVGKGEGFCGVLVIIREG